MVTKRALCIACCLVTAGCAVFGPPEEIRLVATKDLVIFADRTLDHSAHVGKLAEGEAATVLACEDAKSVIPIKIRTASGLVGYVRAPYIRLQRRMAGPGTKDMAWGCFGSFGPVSEPFE